MTAAAQTVLVFEPRYGGREVAMLGGVTVGEVAEFTGGRVRAYWRCGLPGASALPRPAASFAAAREALRAHVEQWLEAALPALRRELVPLETALEPYSLPRAERAFTETARARR